MLENVLSPPKIRTYDIFDRFCVQVMHADEVIERTSLFTLPFPIFCCFLLTTIPIPLLQFSSKEKPESEIIILEEGLLST